MKITTKIAVLLLVLSTVPLCRAADITYNVNPTTFGTGSATGTITTDGTIGLLSNTNIVSWDITLNDGVDPPIALTNLNSGESTEPALDLSATATELLFNFTGPSSSPGLFYFSNTNALPGGTVPPASSSGVCWSSATNCTDPFNLQTGDSLEIGGSGPIEYTPRTGNSMIATTPEPSTLVLLFGGLAFLGLSLNIRRKKLNLGDVG